MTTEPADATAVRGFGDDRLIINLSVWTGIEALSGFVFASAHRPVMQRRRAWFVPLREACTALWWVPAGTQPTVRDAEERVAALQELGPSPTAFTFRHPYTAPGLVAREPETAQLSDR